MKTLTILAFLASGCLFKSSTDERCETYCDLMAENCDNTFDDYAECLATCSTYPSEPEDVDEETGFAPNDDTVECRTYHAQNASAGKNGVHCAHASEGGGGICQAVTAPCGEYCEIVVEFCAGTEGAVGSTDECLETCNGLPRGGADDIGGDSAHCRTNWAKTASENDDTSLCVNAAFDSPKCVN